VDNAHIGIIPGPHELEIHVNSYLRPIVDDLLDLHTGINMEDSSGQRHLVKALLLGVSADIPASRKVSQFLGLLSLPISGEPRRW
jgi:hypothetical protein